VKQQSSNDAFMKSRNKFADTISTRKAFH